MAVAAPASDASLTARQMSSDFLARRKIYEHGEPTIFYSAITKVAAAGPGSDNVANATPKPISRKSSASPVDPEAIPRVRSTESLRRHSHRLSYEARPNVPRRSSSIRLKQSRKQRGSKDLQSLHRQSVQLFSSLDTSVQHQLTATATATTNGEQRISIEDVQHPAPGGMFTAHSQSQLREDSPLGFTLARKRTSLPPMDVTADNQLCIRDSRLTERDSCISHRDRESFLASFPQPPKSAPPSKLVHTHRRNSSSQNYSLFPRAPAKHEVMVEESSPRPSVSQSSRPDDQPEQLEALPPIEDNTRIQEPVQSTTQRPEVVVERSYSALAMAHPNVSFSNPNFSNVSLHLHLNPTTTEAVSWTSPESRAKEYAKIDAAQSLRKRTVRKIAPRWVFGSLGADRSAFTEKFDAEETADGGSVRRFRADGVRHMDEKSTELDSKTSLKRKASSLFGIKEQTSSTSTSNLLENKAGFGNVKRSFFRRLACF